VKSVTEKLVQKVRTQASIDSQHVDGLMNRWRCDLSTCPQQKGFCYIVDGIHLRLMPFNLKAWSIAINNGDADLETAPATLAKTFMTSKTTQKHPLRENTQRTPAKASHLMQPVPQTPPVFPQSYPPPPPYYHPYSLNPPQYPQFTSPYLYPPPGNPFPDVHQTKRQRSSSLPSEFGDLIDKLEEYFSWLIKKAPGMKEQLLECLAVLKKKDIVLDTLPSITDAHYSRWEQEGEKKISDGIKLLVEGQLKKWK